jgi:hypothetical protein
MSNTHEVGAELRAALEERGCALGAGEARALSCLLIDLISEGLIAVDREETAPAYNMGQSIYIQGGDRE